MTNEQKELCLSIKLAAIKGIVYIDNETLWKAIEKVVKEGDNAEQSKE
jgi:hypothetical protein